MPWPKRFNFGAAVWFPSFPDFLRCDANCGAMQRQFRAGTNPERGSLPGPRPLADALTSRNARCVFGVLHYVLSMKQSDIFRENAKNCLQLAEQAEGRPAYRRYVRMARAWAALAREQQWLDGEISPLPIKTEELA